MVAKRIRVRRAAMPIPEESRPLFYGEFKDAPIGTVFYFADTDYKWASTIWFLKVDDEWVKEKNGEMHIVFPERMVQEVEELM